MQIGLKMLIAAICSLTLGVAFASPMLISEINNKPETQKVQDCTEDVNVEIVYSNNTVPNNSSIAYRINLNSTSLADIGSKSAVGNSTIEEKVNNIIVNGIKSEDWGSRAVPPGIGAVERILVYEKWENTTHGNTHVAIYYLRVLNVTGPPTDIP